MKSKICISIDRTILLSIKEKAKKEDRTLSNYINKILKEKIERGN